MKAQMGSTEAVTHGPLSHWFGYYDMPCWECDNNMVMFFCFSLQ